MKSLFRLSRATSTNHGVVRGRTAFCVRVTTRPPTCWQSNRRPFGSSRSLRQDAPVHSLPSADLLHNEGGLTDVTNFAKSLPVACSGGGALSQTVEADAPGFYSQKRRNVKKAEKQSEDHVFQQALARLASRGDTILPETPSEPAAAHTGESLICDRCHDLLYQSKGTSILHPSMQSIQDIIESSPHKHNHIYHVLDAADFPMSLIPNLMSALKLPRLRTQNRRSKSKQYTRGRVADISFIITRSDLLAPRKEQVDRLMPYLQEILRDALGRSGKSLRLGNVRCVSSKRGWWTPNVKQEVWGRGGAGWVVGKVNVGKSALFEVIYPKGRTGQHAETLNIQARRDTGASQQIIDEAVTAEHKMGDVDSVVQLAVTQDEISEDMDSISIKDNEDLGPVDREADDMTTARPPKSESEKNAYDENDDDDDDNNYDYVSLLPPPQPETQYPQMPVVSALPGTTASPIRIPFGNGKGELIDLPGVQRSSMETHVQPEHHKSLVMESRVVPEQFSLKPGQSLLLGGFIRLTPKVDGMVVLAYPFTPLHAHRTATEKAVAIQTGVHPDGLPYTGAVENIATDKAKQRIKSAGVFKLEWDVTKQRAGPVTDRTAGKQKAEDLPYIVYGADILIEGVGWVELVCQVRSRRRSLISDAFSSAIGNDRADADSRPEVEVFTPKGKFIAVRKPMNAWLLGGPKKVAKHARRLRPRMSISMQRRKEGGRKGSTGSP